ncbi:MAG TPA: type II secretion system protein [Candidatus Paceibacterota bacterium]|nr:type II secretion system protein [Candidatus Paceibacterota bacterium]
MRNRQGFTLIELLVVVSIIGLISSIVFSSLSTARAKSRDSKRKQDLVQLRNAVELYYAQNGAYPIPPASSAIWRGTFCGYGNASTNWIPGLTDSSRGGPFIAALPKDPKPLSSCLPGHGYLYRSDGKDYQLLAWNSVESEIVSPTHSLQRRRPPCALDTWGGNVGERTYALQTEGAAKACW